MLIDLSHTMEDHQPNYPTHTKFYRMWWSRLEFGDRSAHAQIIMGEHSATHVDAPSHFFADKASIDRVPLDRFCGPGRCFDMTEVAPGDVVEARLLMAAEQADGPLEPGEILLLHYGHDRYWQVGAGARTYREAWPGLSAEAAEFLVSRGIKAVGTDAISIDSSRQDSIAAHRVLLDADVLIYENLTGLKPLIGRRFRFWGWPLRIGGGTGSPVRAVAELNA